MIKIWGVLLLAVGLYFLSSCTLEGKEMAIFDDTDIKADERMGQVVDAIKAHDKEVLKSMFSEKALNEADDLDSSLEHLFEFIRGDIISWEDSGGSGASGEIEAGRVTLKEVDTYYYVITDKQKYFFYIKDCHIDYEHPENVGFSLILVVRAEEEEKIYAKNQKKIFDGEGKLSPVGICIPFE